MQLPYPFLAQSSFYTLTRMQNLIHRVQNIRLTTRQCQTPLEGVKLQGEGDMTNYRKIEKRAHDA